MNFDFDDQQLELHSMLQRALADALPFETYSARGADDSIAWNLLAELGLFGLLVPEARGGMGLTLVDLALIVEEFGTLLVPQSIVDMLAATDTIARHASETQGSRWLEGIVEGTLRVAVAWHESEAGYDPERMSTILKDGVLTGEKMLVAFAGKADFLLVPFRYSTTTRTGLAMVDLKASGVKVEQSETLDPFCDYHRVIFSGVSLAPDCILDGYAPQIATRRLFDVMAAIQAAFALGISTTLTTRSADYARERIQFDKPIGSFQAIKHKCADMYTQVEAARAAAYYALCALAEAVDDGPRAASMAKAFCCDTAIKCCHDAIQIHGGMGFTWELGLHFFLRRIRVMAAQYGDSDFHRERVIAATLSALSQTESAQARTAA